VSTTKPSAGGSWGEWGAEMLKLSSALFGLAAAGLLVLPLLRGGTEAPSGPRYLTLEPVFSSDSESGDSASGESAPSAQAIQEERSRFTGAILMVESQPPGATVRVNGIDQGEAPVSVGLDCLPGRELVIDFSLPGFEKSTHRTLCPRDTLVKVTARLRKGSGRSSGKR
jgi:hypothetical protein